MSQAPTGHVTIVFTDIQGSTALWERLRSDFKPLLDRHNRIFRKAIETFGGYEVKTEGDAFMVAFADPRAAVAMCMAVQEQLQAADWPEALEDPALARVAGTSRDGRFRGLRVRMGVHCGASEAQPDPVTGRMDYFGTEVIRAARVGAIGHGGQTVISEAVFDTLGDVSGIDLRALGEHELKGLERSEKLWQVLPEALSGRRFPPLKGGLRPKTNLPAPIDSFIGREAELAELQRRIAEGQRLITLLGAGGTGKTRLSQQFGSAQLGNFPGGVWFCDLAEARTEDGVLAAMGSALSLALTGQDPSAQLADAVLGRRRALFILDNFEQVVDLAPATVGRWMRRAPEAVFLVTSRSLLRVAGEHLFPLEPLPIDEAVKLFCDRARAVRSSFSPAAVEPGVLNEIVERIDRLSLAIELAAARVRTMTPEQILRRLSQRFKLLSGRRRDQSARQATLRGAIDWSWDLLSPVERSTLAQLSVFRDGFTVEAAEGVVALDGVDDEPWVPDLVEALVDHSLLRRTEPEFGSVRYRLFESVREYAAEKLGDSADHVALRHARTFAALGADSFASSLVPPGGSSLEFELENLLQGAEFGLSAGEAALTAGCALGASEVLLTRGPGPKAVALLERVLVQDHDERIRCRLMGVSSLVLAWVGQLDRSMTRGRGALELARSLGDREIEGAILGRCTATLMDSGAIPDALVFCWEALQIAEETGNRRAEAIERNSLANLHHHVGRLDDAMAGYERAVKIAEELGDQRLWVANISSIATLQMSLGRLDEAADGFGRVLRTVRRLGDRRQECIIAANLANIRESKGQFAEAADGYERAIGIARELGNRMFECIALGNLGSLTVKLERPDEAEPMLVEAMAIAQEAIPYAGGAFAGSLALIRAQQGRIDEARALLDQGEQLLRDVSRVELGKLLCKRVQIELEAGDRSAAVAAATRAENLAEEHRITPESELAQALEMVRAMLG